MNFTFSDVQAGRPQQTFWTPFWNTARTLAWKGGGRLITGRKENTHGSQASEDVFQPTLTSRGHKGRLPLAHVFLTSVILFLPLRHILDLKFLLYFWALSGSVCACVYLCTCVCSCVCVYMHVPLCTCVRVCGLVFTCTHTGSCVYVCACLIICACMNICVCIYVCMFFCAYVGAVEWCPLGMSYVLFSWVAGSSDYPQDTCAGLGPLTSFMEVGEGLIGPCLLPNDVWTVNGCLEWEIQCSYL